MSGVVSFHVPMCDNLCASLAPLRPTPNHVNDFRFVDAARGFRELQDDSSSSCQECGSQVSELLQLGSARHVHPHASQAFSKASTQQMARIKETGKRNGAGAKSHVTPKSPLESSTPAPAPTVNPPERCKIVMEMGASHTQIMIKRPGKAWEYVKFGRGAGASSISGVDVVPTMTAIRSRDDSLDVRHGISALNARISDSRSWTVFQHLKHAYLSEAPTADVDRTLKNQQKVARERGWDIEDLADKYFYDILSTATKEDIGSPIFFTNISDVWPNKVAQRLICGFQKILPGAEVHGVNECLSSLIGAMSMETTTAAEPVQLVYVDCGHSTMVGTCKN
jgi:hypothetical protein